MRRWLQLDSQVSPLCLHRRCQLQPLELALECRNRRRPLAGLPVEARVVVELPLLAGLVRLAIR